MECRPEPPIRYSRPFKQQYGPPAPDEYGPPPSPSYGHPIPAKQTLITKNVYVHLPPPEEPEPERIREIETTRKHYKIVFIKAPTPPTPQALKLPPQDEHKTLVYVLVKKPDPEPSIEVPNTTEPSRPEVYFIKYKENNKLSNSYGPPN